MIIFTEPIVIKQFHPKDGLEKGEGAEQLLNQLAAYALFLSIFLLPPALFIEYTLTPYLERGL